MKSNKVHTLKYLINLSFFLYFLILLVERVLSIVLSLTNGGQLFDNFYHGFTYILVFISLATTIVYLLITSKNHFKGLFTRNNEIHDLISYKKLSIASGILLISGMVHLDTNLSILQFTSYGILIVGLLLQTIIVNKESKDRFTLWLSFVYIVCFAMAVPVVYPVVSSDITWLIYLLEIITMLLLVLFFTYFEIKLFAKKDNLFDVVPFVAIIILDAAILALRWSMEEEMIKGANTFVLIFIVATTIIYLIYIGYKLICKLKKDK